MLKPFRASLPRIKLQLRQVSFDSCSQFSSCAKKWQNTSTVKPQNHFLKLQPVQFISFTRNFTTLSVNMDADLTTTTTNNNNNANLANTDDNNPKEGNDFTKGVITGLPKKWVKKKLESLLSSNQIKFKKLKKIPTMTHGDVVFETVDDFEKAKLIIETLQVDGKNLRMSVKRANTGVKRPSSSQHNERISQKLKVNEDGSPRTIHDVVTPLYKVPYAEQIEKKNTEAITAFRDMIYRIKKESGTEMPSWLETFFSHKGGSSELPFPVEKIVPSPIIDYYRNKVAFSIGKDLEGKTCIGFNMGRMADSIDALADASECRNVSIAANTIRKSLLEYIVSRQEANPKLTTWDKFIHKGFWRQLTVRTYASGENMVILQVNPSGLTNEEIETEKKNYISWSESLKPLVHSLMWQEHSGVSNAAPMDCKCHLLAGSEYVHEVLMGTKFRISPNAFFQVNSKATEVLYGLIKDWSINDAKAATETTVLDVCCGTGTIGLSIAPHVKKVIGVEMQPEAVEDAIVNAKLNNITNATFMAGKAEGINFIIDCQLTPPDVLLKTLKTMEDGEYVAIVDPPRSGLHPDVVKALRACSGIKYLIYISCDAQQGLVPNASGLCRKSTNTKGEPFVPVKATSVDLFPHAQGFEAVVLFRR